jgi:hypothetical protein
MVVDILAPIGLYYGIRAAGGSVWLALLVGGVAPAVSALTGILTRRRVDAMGLVMLAALGASYLHRAAGDNQCLLRPIRVLAHPAYRSIVLTSVDHRKCQAMRES